MCHKREEQSVRLSSVKACDFRIKLHEGKWNKHPSSRGKEHVRITTVHSLLLRFLKGDHGHQIISEFHIGYFQEQYDCNLKCLHLQYSKNVLFLSYLKSAIMGRLGGSAGSESTSGSLLPELGAENRAGLGFSLPQNKIPKN